jgi:hypothetical protein
MAATFYDHDIARRFKRFPDAVHRNAIAGRDRVGDELVALTEATVIVEVRGDEHENGLTPQQDDLLAIRF